MTGIIHTFTKQSSVHPLEREHIDSCVRDVMRMAHMYLRDLDQPCVRSTPHLDNFMRMAKNIRRLNRDCLFLTPLDVDQLLDPANHYHMMHKDAMDSPRLSGKMPIFQKRVQQYVIEDSGLYLDDVAVAMKQTSGRGKIENLTLFNPAKYFLLQKSRSVKIAIHLQGEIDQILLNQSFTGEVSLSAYQPLTLVEKRKPEISPPA